MKRSDLICAGKKAIAKSLTKVSLRNTITIPFLVQICAIVGIVGYLSYRTGQRSVYEITGQLQTELAGRIEEKLEAYLQIPHRVNQLTVGAVEQGVLPLDFGGDTTAQTKFLTHQLITFPELRWISCGTEIGDEFLGVTRRGENQQLMVAIANKKNNFQTHYYEVDSQGNRLSNRPVEVESKTYILKERPWYETPVKAGKPTWVRIYPDLTTKNKELYLTASYPIYQAETKQLLGVCSADITLSDLDDFLENLFIEKQKTIVIAERNGRLIATSTGQPSFSTSDLAQSYRLDISQSKNKFVAFMGNYLDQKLGNWRGINKPQSIIFRYQNQTQWLKIFPFQDDRQLDWLILVAVPESAFMAGIYANVQQNFVLSGLAIAGTLILGFLTASWVIIPLKNFTKSVKSVTLGNWQQSLAEKERVDEIGTLAQSVEIMASQLEISFVSLEAQNKELKRLDKLKDEFLSNTSHELRTPLNGIIGIAESLLDGVTGELNAETKRNLLMIVSSGRRLGSLVDDLLDFFKLKHTELELQRKPIALRELVEVVLTLSKPLVKHSPIELQNHVPSDLPLVDADENRLQQIFHNLIGNGIKFTDQGTIRVEAKQQDGEILIEVIDTGIGIAVDQQQRIFESFEQADGSSARHYGGTGLGLAITKKLVELHGGTIVVESQPEQGSTFRFTLPISQQPLPVTPTPETAQTWEQLEQSFMMRRSAGDWDEKSFFEPQVLRADYPETYSILIVDDEPVNLQVLVNHLSLQNYAIAQARSGMEALELIGSGLKPDIVLLDIMMPRMTGYEVCEKLRETYSLDELPIVMLTAKNQVQDLVAGFNCGANDYLTKPISKTELLARLKTHLQLSSIALKNTQLYFQLSESEVRLRHFLEAMPVGVVIVRSEGKPYYLNRLAIDMLQKGVLDEVTMENIAQTYNLYQAGTTEYYTSQNLSLIQAILGNASSTDDIEIRRGDGVVIPIESWGTPIKNDAGEVEFAIVAFQDIRQRRQTEAEREEYIQKLSQLNLSLSRFLPREFLQLLGKTSIEEVNLGDQTKREMTILFADIRKFTTISEQISSEEAFILLNDYLGRMEPLIQRHSGFIDKYIGDGIMALFPNQPQDAVKAAIAMLEVLEQPTNPSLPALQIGIGIHTGSSLLGTVGGQNRMETTVIGDTVNLASRVESLTKFYGVRLLITEETYQFCQDLTVREIDRVTVRGRTKPTTLYEVLLPSDQKKLANLALFNQAIASYFEDKQELAHRLFLELQQLDPEDSVVKIHGDRLSQQLKANLKKYIQG